MSRPSREQIIEYAIKGVLTELGSHPAPLNYPEEIEEYEKHYEWLKAELERIRTKTIQD